MCALLGRRIRITQRITCRRRSHMRVTPSHRPDKALGSFLKCQNHVVLLLAVFFQLGMRAIPRHRCAAGKLLSRVLNGRGISGLDLIDDLLEDRLALLVKVTIAPRMGPRGTKRAKWGSTESRHLSNTATRFFRSSMILALQNPYSRRAAPSVQMEAIAACNNRQTLFSIII